MRQKPMSSAPRDGTEILAFFDVRTRVGDVVCVAWCDNLWCLGDNRGYTSDYFTGWIEKPLPPEGVASTAEAMPLRRMLPMSEAPWDGTWIIVWFDADPDANGVSATIARWHLDEWLDCCDDALDEQMMLGWEPFDATRPVLGK